MTRPLLPLAIFGAPQPGDPEAIRTVEAALHLPYDLSLVVAQPASPSRVVALRERPTFAVEHALVTNPANLDALYAAMRWALHIVEIDARATALDGHLSIMLGGPVREITHELEPEDPRGSFDPNEPLASLAHPVTRRYNPNDHV